jgi:hypothetical protein
MKYDYPLMYRIRQQFESLALKDVEAAVEAQFSKIDISAKIKPGQRAAIAVGSRGIDNLPGIVAAVVKCLRRSGLKPFIIPAMGSHGQATAEGQINLLNDLGVNKTSVGAPIISTMDVISLGHTDSGAEVFVSKDAFDADHLVVVNRVKPHTAFQADVESGLCKMLTVGCGKHAGAIQMHKYGLAASIVPAAKKIIENLSVLCGLAVVEDSLDRIYQVKWALPESFAVVDRECLQGARRRFPRIPLDDLDILVIDEMGKNLSGAGMDPNVVGFWRRVGGPRKPDFRTLVVLDLTDESHGNAIGVGMADLIPRRVKDKIDWKATYTNAIASGIWVSARLPVTLENDRQVIETALSKVAQIEKVRMARIVNTLHLETFWATEPLLPELSKIDRIRIDEEPLRMQFNAQDRLLAF